MFEYHDRNATATGHWALAAVALVVLVILDLVTSLYAAQVVGLEYEANPVMALVLAQPLELILAIHLAVLAVAAGLLYVMIEAVRSLHGTERVRAQRRIELFLVGLIAIGVVVVTNNLLVIGFGVSLV